MADLSEYLGHLVCEITRSRVMADYETVRLAQEYAADESGLLRYFPVPRMRLPTLELTLPVVVTDIPDGYAEVTSTPPKLFAVLILQGTMPTLEKHAIKLDLGSITKVVLADPLLAQGRLATDVVDSLSASLAQASVDAEMGNQEPKDPDDPTPLDLKAAKRLIEVTGLLREPLGKVITALPRRRAGVRIDGRTAAVKEVGDVAKVVNIKMTITEDAMEIVLAPPIEGEPEKIVISKLIPD